VHALELLAAELGRAAGRLAADPLGLGDDPLGLGLGGLALLARRRQQLVGLGAHALGGGALLGALGRHQLRVAARLGPDLLGGLLGGADDLAHLVGGDGGQRRRHRPVGLLERPRDLLEPARALRLHARARQLVVDQHAQLVEKLEDLLAVEPDRVAEGQRPRLVDEVVEAVDRGKDLHRVLRRRVRRRHSAPLPRLLRAGAQAE
jgi:hypothetical protein